jgi:hypothetical protein
MKCEPPIIADLGEKHHGGSDLYPLEIVDEVYNSPYGSII